MKDDKPCHAKRRGWLKNCNKPGDFSTASLCGAKTRTGRPCKSPAMANGRCRMHGGPNPGGPVGNQYALKHGFRTKRAIAERKMISQLLRDSRRLIEEI
jgi:hypothetical protein